jgi:hypothetical protein
MQKEWFQGGVLMRSFSGSSIGGLLLFLWLVAPSAADADAYEWTDGQGTTHFTDDLTTVPSSFQGKVKTVPLPEQPVRLNKPPDEPAAEAVEEENQEVSAYESCTAGAEKARKGLQESLASDRERLEKLNRMIHRTTVSRYKNEYQRERAELKDRIEANQKKLDTEVPEMERACERSRPYVP